MANDALGNFAVATPIAQMLRRQHKPGHLTLFTGPRVREFAEASDLFDSFHMWLGAEPRETASAALALEPFDLVVNLEQMPWASALAGMLAGENGFVAGPCVGKGSRERLPFGDSQQGRLWEDKEWVSPDVVHRHPLLESGFIAEIFARACHLTGPVPPYKFPQQKPNLTVPDVIVATTASLPDKIWPPDKWIALIQRLQTKGWSVGIVGAAPKVQAEHWLGANDENTIVESSGMTDLRGKLTLPQVVGALAQAKAVVTLDNGIMHMAASTGVPTFGLFRPHIHRLWAPPLPNVVVIEPGPMRGVADLTVSEVEEKLNNFQIPLAYF